MLLRSSKRCSALLPVLKTQRFIRRFQSSAESKDFFSSYSTPVPAAPPSGPHPVWPQPNCPPIPKPNKFVSALKFLAFSAAAATIGAAGYATYEYTADEVDEKTKDFRSSINYPSGNATATVEDISHRVYTAVMTVPCRAVNIYLDLRRLIEERVQELAEPFDKLLPNLPEEQYLAGVQTLVLDLTGTLIYREWKIDLNHKYDCNILECCTCRAPIVNFQSLSARETGWRTYKRPGLDHFLEEMFQCRYEIVVYSDEMVDPLVSQKFWEKGVRYVLSRSHTKYQKGKHYRDLSKLNRDPSRIIYISANALDNCLQPENAIPIKPWEKEVDDTALTDLIPFLRYVSLTKPDIRGVAASFEGRDIPTEFAERAQRLLQKPTTSRWRRNF